jgi:hypothetical protein
MTPAEIAAAGEYLDSVADELEVNGVAVDSIVIDARRPSSARLAVRWMDHEAFNRAIELSWQQGFGWSLDTRGRSDNPDEGWFYLYADDSAAPAVIVDFVTTSFPAVPPARVPEQPADQQQHAGRSGSDRPVAS